MPKVTIGKAVKGVVLHFSIKTDDKKIVARCDKKLEIIPVKNASIPDVSCARCKTFSEFKNHNQPKKKPDQPKKKPDQPKKKPDQPKKKQSSKPDLAALVLNRMDTLCETIDKVVSRIEKLEAKPNPVTTTTNSEDSKKFTEENYKEILKKGQKPKEIGTVTGNQFKSISTGDDVFSIKHLASDQHMFTKVPEDVIGTAIKYLNNLKIHWANKNDPVPKNFVSACAAAFKAACASHGVKLQIGKEEADKERPKRVIKRREKSTAKRIIKRREKKTDGLDRYGFRLNSLRNFISLFLEHGIHFANLHKELSQNYKFSEKQSKSKLNYVMRKLIRNGYPIMTIKTKDSNQTFYQIIENTE